MKDSPSIEPYKYKNLKEGEIRILHLQPGDEDDSVFISISCEKLDREMMENEKLKYKALSWQWGTREEDEYVRVKDRDSEGLSIFKLNVKTNLLNALKRLRQREKEIRLWVDAICINQSTGTPHGASERSKQISMMTKIYETAEEVCIWIGMADDDSKEAVGFIDSLVNLDDINHIAALGPRETDESIARKLLCLIKLLKRGWFSRRWVIQEIAVARYAKLYCGNDTVEWTNVADATTLLEKFGRDGTIDRYLRSIPSTPIAGREIANISSLPAYRLVQNTTGMSRGSSKRDVKTWRYTLEELVSFLAAFKASRLHDTLHAIVGLSSDFIPESTADGDEDKNNPDKASGNQGLTPFKIDYDKPALVIFKRFLNEAINKSKSLDIICRPWAPKDGEDGEGNYISDIELPSWIPSLDRKPFQQNLDRNMVRHNPDPLVGPAMFRQRFYTASRSEEMFFEIPEIEDPQLKCLIVEGFVLGKIGKIWGCGHFGNVPSQWLRAGGWTNAEKRPPEELWRTLVGDRNQHGGDPDRWYPRVFQSAVEDRGISYGFETYRLIYESTNATVPELFRRVQAVVWNRRLVRVQGEFVEWLGESKDPSSGALGLAPSEAQEGDSVCIIFGCSVPLVLRSCSRPSRAKTNANPPLEENGPPLEGSDPPLEENDPPLEENDPPLEENDPPLEENDPPLEGSDPPLEENDPPLEENDPPLEENGPPLEENGPPLEENDPPQNGGLYTIIGECYVDHMMDGEAISFFKDKGFKRLKFEFVK